MRLTQGAALVAVAACNGNESKPGDAITNEAVSSAAPSAMLPTVNAVATPAAVSATAAPMPSAETAPPAASASASASAATPPAKPPGGQVGPVPTPIHVNSPPKRINSTPPIRVNTPDIQ
ncbi:MAG TPA: hypothetical protein PK156_09840 [Polyangium sp.]|nr:hypothetical protein [Polyangium sp.]